MFPSVDCSGDHMMIKQCDESSFSCTSAEISIRQDLCWHWALFSLEACILKIGFWSLLLSGQMIIPEFI